MYDFKKNPPSFLNENELDNTIIITDIPNQPRMSKINGQKYYWSPKQDCYILVPKVKKAKKTYLQRIIDIFEINKNKDFISYTEILINVKDKWDEEKNFDENFFIKALVKGINQYVLEQKNVLKEKNKYKGHDYKLI